jgi:hypothetical protein
MPMNSVLTRVVYYVVMCELLYDARVLDCIEKHINSKTEAAFIHLWTPKLEVVHHFHTIEKCLCFSLLPCEKIGCLRSVLRP